MPTELSAQAESDQTTKNHNIKKLAARFAEYLKYYWARHNIDFNLNLENFPADITITHQALSGSKKLDSRRQQKYLDLQKNFSQYSSVDRFYLERTSDDIENRIRESKLFFEIIAGLSDFDCSDIQGLFHEFANRVRSKQTDGGLFSPTPLPKEYGYAQMFGYSAAAMFRNTGLAKQSTLERVYSIFYSEFQCSEEQQQYLNLIIRPINNNSFLIGETKKMETSSSEDKLVTSGQSEGASAIAASPVASNSSSPVSKLSDAAAESTDKASAVADVADLNNQTAQSLLARTKDRLTSCLSVPSFRLAMPAMSTVAALTAVAALSGATVYAVRSGYRPQGLFNLFSRSDSSTDCSLIDTAAVAAKPASDAVKAVAKPVAKIVVRAANPVVKPVVQTALHATKPAVEAVATVARPSSR